MSQTGPTAVIQAPDPVNAYGYRVYAYVRDGKGNVASGSISFIGVGSAAASLTTPRPTTTPNTPATATATTLPATVDVGDDTPSSAPSPGTTGQATTSAATTPGSPKDDAADADSESSRGLPVVVPAAAVGLFLAYPIRVLVHSQSNSQ